MSKQIIVNSNECKTETDFIELPDKSRVRTTGLPIDLAFLEEQNSALRLIFKCGIYIGAAGILIQTWRGDFAIGILGFIYVFLLFYPAKYYAERSAHLVGILMKIGGERPIELVLKTRNFIEALEQFNMLSLVYLPNSKLDSIKLGESELADINNTRADLIERLRNEKIVKLVA